MQAYVGYTRATKKKSVTFKVGQIVSAFGSYPLRYDDATNPLLDSPISYGGGDYGRFPVTLYGLPGAEVDAVLNRVDARLQFTSSAPSNPQGLLSADQNPNWAAGAGYTIRQGFRIGGSVQRGGYLTLGRFLTTADNPRDWPFTAVGVDLQWARSRWSVNAEWHRFYYLYPRYLRSPAVQNAYVEVKAVLRPRLYAATRVQYRRALSAQTDVQPRPVTFAPARQVYEFALGCHLNRSQMLKVGYEWLRADNIRGTHDNVFGVQWVTSLDVLSKAFH